MDKIKDSKAFRIALSILAAFMLWLYVDNIDPSIVSLDVRNIPVEFTGEEDVLDERGLMITSDKDVTIDLTLKAQRKVISSLGTGKDIRIELDLSAITTTGQHSLDYDIIFPDSVNERDVEIVSASAYRVTVDVVELYKKSVPIKGERVGSVAEGYMAGEMSFSESTVLVSGEQLAVSNISHALVEVDLAGAKEKISREVAFKLIDFNGEEVDASDFRASIDTVRVSVPVLMIKELDLVVDFEYSNGSSETNVAHSILPSKITVAGDPKSLSSLDEIVLSSIDLSELTRDISYALPIPIPAGSTNLSGETSATLTISFINVETRTFTATDISFINAPEGKSVTAVTNFVNVTLRGPRASLEMVEPFNIRVVGDMTDVTADNGNYAIPAEVYVDGTDQVGAIGTYQITVRVGS